MTGYEHRLVGARPEPLGSYLKALGVLRLVAEQADPGATGHWEPDAFVLRTTLDDDALERFFLTSYQPTPLVSPWNKSSGFGPEGADELQAIEESEGPRLAPYRQAIAVARELLDQQAAEAWSKERMLQEARSRLPDGCLPWLDAAAVLTDDRAVYPPLLGTGGNDGRLEFSRNFHQRLLDVLGLVARRGHDRRAWLVDALFDQGTSVGLRGPSPGQFDPGSAGGANSAATGSAPAVLNPWDWVLLMEGALLLASGSARRLASRAPGRAAAPFTVDASAAGYSTASEGESSRGELWAPLWSRPSGLAELRQLFAEGRADWRERHAASGLDLAKAAATLGVDRGIVAFSRHAFVERFGLSTVAAPIGRVSVGERPAVAPLADLDRWLDRVRRVANPPASVSGALRAVDRASFELAAEGRPTQLFRVLVLAAQLEAAVARSTGFRERARERVRLGPVAGLDSRPWLAALDVDSQRPEVRLAACLASQRDEAAGRGPGLLRLLLRPVQVVAGGRLDWADGPPEVEGFGRRPVVDVLADALARRALRTSEPAGSSADQEQPGPRMYPAAGLIADLTDLADLVAGRLDEGLLDEGLSAFLLLDWRGGGQPAWRRAAAVPPVLALVAPFFTPPIELPGPPRQVGAASTDPAAATDWNVKLNSTALVPEAHWPAALAAGRLEPVTAGALRRLRIAGLEPVPADVTRLAAGTNAATARRLGAALLCRVSSATRRRLLAQICPDPDLSRQPAESVATAPEHPPTQGEQRVES